ncbi:uncharacterized protein LOC143342617 isoform X1 [Colletes latitarsis]|uniref:uncharacterized protein LOC143342617 isoform X1 n=1 Tax=Colletes latitarsis TaxID=2605962 RepID=UPI0040365C2A
MRIIFVYICKVERKEETIRLGRLTLILVPVQMEVTPYFRSSFFLGPTGDDACRVAVVSKRRAVVSKLPPCILPSRPKGTLKDTAYKESSRVLVTTVTTCCFACRRHLCIGDFSCACVPNAVKLEGEECVTSMSSQIAGGKAPWCEVINVPGVYLLEHLETLGCSLEWFLV